MRVHNIWFYEEIEKNYPYYPVLSGASVHLGFTPFLTVFQLFSLTSWPTENSALKIFGDVTWFFIGECISA